MGALPSRVFVAPITCVHIQPAVYELQGERMKRREHCSSLHTASTLPRISGEHWMLRRREKEGKKKGERKKGIKRIHIYLICNFLGRLAGLITRCTTYTYRLSVSGVVTWVQGSIFYTDGENSSISNPLVGWQLAKNKFLIFLWMCLVNHYFFSSHLFRVFNALFSCALMTREDRFSSVFLQWKLYFSSIYNKTSNHMWPNMQNIPVCCCSAT